jgi:hypothetical protein
VIYHGPDDRAALLLELGQALETQAVPASFWACLQVADLPALRTFIQEEPRAAPRLYKMLSDTFYTLPQIWRDWRQNPPKDRSSSCSSSLRESNLSDAVPVPGQLEKSPKNAMGASAWSLDVRKSKFVNIFPNCLLKKKKPTDLTRSIPDL